MTNWIVTQTTRFKAASAGASIADLADLYYLHRGRRGDGRVLQASVGEPGRLPGASPLTHVMKVATPLLIQHGDRDPRATVGDRTEVPSRHSPRSVRPWSSTSIREAGVSFYEPAQERAVMQRNFDWFRRWIAH